MNATERDPYATPPTHKSKSGPVVRFVIVGALLATGAAGFMSMPRSGQSLVPTEAEQTTTLASNEDGSYVASSANEFTEPPANTAPAASPAPRAAPRDSAPAVSQAPAEDLPPPTTTTAPMTDPTPLPPG